MHSIAASLFLPRERIHFFDPIGYHHESLGHCPMEDTTWTNARCACSREHTFGTPAPLSPYSVREVAETYALARHYVLLMQEPLGPRIERATHVLGALLDILLHLPGFVRGWLHDVDTLHQKDL